MQNKPLILAAMRSAAVIVWPNLKSAADPLAPLDAAQRKSIEDLALAVIDTCSSHLDKQADTLSHQARGFADRLARGAHDKGQAVALSNLKKAHQRKARAFRRAADNLRGIPDTRARHADDD